MSILAGRGKELEENGFGVVLEKKEGEGFAAPTPGELLVLPGKTEFKTILQGIFGLIDSIRELAIAIRDSIKLLEIL